MGRGLILKTPELMDTVPALESLKLLNPFSYSPVTLFNLENIYSQETAECIKNSTFCSFKHCSLDTVDI